MKLRTLGANMTEIETQKGTVFFSYNTPVAANIYGNFYRTSKKWSKTTSKHINKWLDGTLSSEKPQEFFDGLFIDI